MCVKCPVVSPPPTLAPSTVWCLFLHLAHHTGDVVRPPALYRGLPRSRALTGERLPWARNSSTLTTCTATTSHRGISAAGGCSGFRWVPALPAALSLGAPDSSGRLLSGGREVLLRPAGPGIHRRPPPHRQLLEFLTVPSPDLLPSGSHLLLVPGCPSPHFSSASWPHFPCSLLVPQGGGAPNPARGPAPALSPGLGFLSQPAPQSGR